MKRLQVSWLVIVHLEQVAMSRLWRPEHSELTLVSSFQDEEREKSSKLAKIKILGQELTLLCCLSLLLFSTSHCNSAVLRTSSSPADFPCGLVNTLKLKASLYFW